MNKRSKKKHRIGKPTNPKSEQITKSAAKTCSSNANGKSRNKKGVVQPLTVTV